MKKALTPTQGTAAVSEPWRAALRTFDQDLQRRGAAERTRRAYGTDAAELAGWATANGLNPQDVDYKVLRRWAARMSQRGAAPRTMARKLASIRSLFRSLLEHGVLESNPADLLPAPKLPQTLPKTLKPDDIARLLERIPASTPLEMRDRALFELAYSSGLRAEELVDLDVTSILFDSEQVRVEGKGVKDPLRPGGRAGAAFDRRLSGASPSGAGQRRRRPRAFPVQERKTFVDVRRPAPPAGVGAARFDADRGAPARTPSFLRNPPAGGRRGPARDPGDARSRQHLDDPGLHSGRVRPASGGVRKEPPAGIKEAALETNVKAIELKDLWRRYKTDGSDKAREQLVVAYSPLVKYVAGRMSSGLPAHVEEADLISYGLLGLINAIERFDLSREIKFETYAITRIKGAIIDELRALDWVPRSVRARAREIEKVHAKLEHKLHRTPTDEEMARELKISTAEFQEALVKISTSTVVALDELWAVSDSSGDAVSLLDTLQDPDAPDPEQLLAQSEVKDRLADAIAALPEREKLVIALYYYENLTLREIGEVLGVTESRISQLHTKAVLRLKSRLQGDNLRD